VTTSGTGETEPTWSRLLQPLLDALQPASVVVCDVETDVGDDVRAFPAGCHVVETTPEALAADLAATGTCDLIWLRGHVNWHVLDALSPTVAAHAAARPADAPDVVVEGEPLPLPEWASNEAYVGNVERAETAKEGIRLGMLALAGALPGTPALLWCAAGTGAAAIVHPTTAARETFCTTARDALDVLNVAHAEHVRDERRRFALFEQLDRAQHSGTAVVRSLRFRVGTRVVRMGRRLARRPKQEIFTAPREILARQRIVARWRAELERERTITPPRPVPENALRVVFVLPQLRLSGGALVVIELMNELRALGVDARIATLQDRRDVYRVRVLDRPLVFDSVDDMVRRLPEVDVAVATHWSTASWVRDLVVRRRASHSAYFVQDYESWFYPESDTETRRAVQESYGLVDAKIATSDWLRDLLARDGYASRKITPGLDLDVFYPRASERAPRPTVLALARPRTPRRGFATVVETLAKVRESMPAVDIVLFGEKLGRMPLPFPYQPEGVITDQDHLARVYQRAWVHFDGSDFQAFGRVALEAMACGTPSVLTDVGGVHEYARDGENCLLVPPGNAGAAADALLRLLQGPDLLDRFRASSLETVRAYSIREKAREMLAFFEELSERRGGASG
jgi:glycosyltransferase involved in cell wall biosynthesis